MELYVAWIGFVGAIVGAIVGGFLAGHYSRQATKDLLDEERENRKIEKKERVKSLLCAIDSEIRNVWDHYMETIGKRIEELPDNQAFRFYVPIIGDYFPVYHGNVNSLGLVIDDTLRHKIISTYNLAKSLVDTYKLNNQLNKERDTASDQLTYTNSSQANRVLQMKEQSLVAYGPMVKAFHLKTKKAIEELLGMLDKVIRITDQAGG